MSKQQTTRKPSKRIKLTITLDPISVAFMWKCIGRATGRRRDVFFELAVDALGTKLAGFAGGIDAATWEDADGWPGPDQGRSAPH